MTIELRQRIHSVKGRCAELGVECVVDGTEGRPGKTTEGLPTNRGRPESSVERLQTQWERSPMQTKLQVYKAIEQERNKWEAKEEKVLLGIGSKSIKSSEDSPVKLRSFALADPLLTLSSVQACLFDMSTSLVYLT